MTYSKESSNKPEYKSSEFLAELKKTAELFLPNLLPDNMKPKAEIATRDFFSKIYKKNMEVVKKVQEIEVSQLLGMNDVVVPSFVSEYRELEGLVVDLKKEYMKGKPLQEAWPIIQEKVKIFDKDRIKNCLFDDLNQLKDFFELDFDIKEALSGNYKPSKVVVEEKPKTKRIKP